METSFNRILNLKELYGETYATRDLINKTFGWSLVAIITQYLVDIICICYWLLLFFGVEDTLPDIRMSVMAFGNLTPILIAFGTLSYHCSLCYQQVSYSYLIRMHFFHFKF